MMVDQGLRLLRCLGVSHVGGWGSRPAAFSAISALLCLTVFNGVAGSFAESAHNRRGTGSAGIRGPSMVATAITVAIDLAA